MLLNLVSPSRRYLMEAASVMIVDDDPDIRNVVRFMLTKAGYQRRGSFRR